MMLWLLACGGSVAVGPPEVPALAASVPTCPGRWVREARPEPAQPTVREEGERVAAWDASADRVAMVSSSRGVVVVDLDGHERWSTNTRDGADVRWLGDTLVVASAYLGRVEGWRDGERLWVHKLPGPVTMMGQEAALARMAVAEGVVAVPMPSHGLAVVDEAGRLRRVWRHHPGVFHAVASGDDWVVALGTGGWGRLQGDAVVGACLPEGMRRVLRVSVAGPTVSVEGDDGVWVRQQGDEPPLLDASAW